jgi:hypothetical protein
MNKWSPYKEEIKTFFATGKMKHNIPEFLGKHGFDITANNKDVLRRYVKKLLGDQTTIEKTLEDNNLNSGDWKIAWLKDDNISMLVRNNEHSDFKSLDQIRKEFKKDLLAYKPTFQKFDRTPFADPHLFVIDIADLHVGKLATEDGTGEKSNTELAKQRAFEGVEGLLKKASGFDIEQILFVIGNDVLHTEAGKGTTSGTPQDSDGMWYDNFKIAREIYVTIIESLLTVAPVHIVHNPSNHDFVSGFMLADTIYSWFHSCPDITFDVNMRHRKYYKYGLSLIGTSHGDGAKMDQLPLLMAEEAKLDWATTEYRYIYLHHLHSKHKYKYHVSEEYIGVTVEYMRSPSVTDYWHHKAGYQHAVGAIEGFIHDKRGGQVAQLSHLFRRTYKR